MIIDWKALAKQMQAARETRNLTIDQLAEQLGRMPGYLAHIERGSIIPIPTRIVRLYEQALGVALVAPGELPEPYSKRKAERSITFPQEFLRYCPCCGQPLPDDHPMRMEKFSP